MKISGLALTLALTGSLAGSTVLAQEPLPQPPATEPPAADLFTYIGEAAVSSASTPNGQGLLPIAVAEAEIALQHARLAAEDSLSLVGMRRHAGHVAHALDPAVVGGIGPGLGFGVRQGTLEAARQVELAAALDSVSENVSVHALRITTPLANVARWSDEGVELAQEIQRARSVAAAVPLVDRLVALCHAIRWGRDADRDGVVGWRDGEGGVAQATYHMNLLRRGEGLAY